MRYIAEDEKKFCLKCGKKAVVEEYGYVWCEAHKDMVNEDPEELETVVLDRVEDLGW